MWRDEHVFLCQSCGPFVSFKFTVTLWICGAAKHEQTGFVSRTLSLIQRARAGMRSVGTSAELHSLRAAFSTRMMEWWLDSWN